MSVAIVMGSKSDYPMVQKTEQVLKDFDVPFTTKILSAHRTPEETWAFAVKAEENGVELFIAVAGMAAHLAGSLAAYTILPVIGVPMKSDTLSGWDSLLSTVQMPPGVPVATVGINGMENAALLAVQILSLKYPDYKEKLRKYKRNMKEKVIKDGKEIEEK
ncbi:MAG: 5-(carboxyamino)imidazole ribonucleotide mutase [Anaerovoracaceae bacterium]|jgi:5-(carboxyamino)imidazole ribonucleotide mutase|nr:5-(carboxyamino)imidazole ribonucleotide mutase [Anaerovoracaceae bacterium]